MNPPVLAEHGAKLGTTGIKASRVRTRIMALIVVSAILTYLDRLNFSFAGKSIQEEFHLDAQTMGWMLSAFLLGYALTQIPGGWLSDKFGPRRLLVFVIIWWSIFTAATALAPNLPTARWFGVAWSFAIIRFLIGVGEAPSSPCYNKIVSYWVGSSHRGFGSSLTLLGIGIGGASTSVLIAWLIYRWGWRFSFYVCGFLGLCLAATWYFFTTDRPEEHSGVNAAELALIREDMDTVHIGKRALTKVPWAMLLKSKSVWALISGYFCQGFPIYFYHTWFFIYLTKVRGYSVVKGSLWATTPYIAIALLSPLGGWFSDKCVARFGLRRGRQRAVWIGMVLSALFLWFGGQTPTPYLSILQLAAAAGLNMFAAVSFWAACIDIGGEHAGSLSGLMNTCGNLGGWLSPIITAYVATHYGWNQAIMTAAVVTLFSAVLWIFVNTEDKLPARDPRDQIA